MTDQTAAIAALVRSVAPDANLDHLRALPYFVDRKAGAEAISWTLYPVSWRSLPRWRLPWRQVNGRACCPTVALFAEAVRRMEAERPTRGAHGFKRDRAPAAVAAE